MNKVVAPSKRILWRHESDCGTVIQFTDTIERTVLVLDAKYRTILSWGIQNKNYNIQKYEYPGWVIDKNSSIEYAKAHFSPEFCKYMSDEELNTWCTFIDENTSRYNTNLLIKYEDTKAAHYCRTQKIENMECDLPNIQTLLRIYCDGEILDSLDPTINQYSEYALGNKNSYAPWHFGIFNRAWSSTSCKEEDEFGAWSLKYDGYIINKSYQYTYGICPVFELN